jgi:hypothetical protein
VKISGLLYKMQKTYIYKFNTLDNGRNCMSMYSAPFRRTLKNATKYVSKDKKMKELILSTPTGQYRKIKEIDENMLSNLAAVGVVNLYLNFTYDLSPVGKELKKQLKQSYKPL